MAVLKIKDANGVWQTVQTLLGNAGGGTGDAIPKAGDRGSLAGYHTLDYKVSGGEVVIDANSPDDTLVVFDDSGNNVLTFMPGEPGTTFVKQVLLENGAAGTVWSWVDDEAENVAIFDTNYDVIYDASFFDVLVYVWYGEIGIIYTKQLI